MASITLSAYDSPGALTPSGAPADPKSLNRQRKRAALSNPTANYLPSNNWLWGPGSAVVDGKPIFTYFDIPRIRRDSGISFCEKLWRAPFGKCKFSVSASGTGSDAGDAKVAQFVQKTLTRFQRNSLPRLLSRYFYWGFCPGAAEFEASNGYLRLSRVRCVEPRDAQPRVFAKGPKRNQFAGFQITNGTVAECDREVRWPHAFWFAGHHDFGEYYDRPPVMGAFEPWLEKQTRGGALQLRQQYFRKNAGHGGILRYPPGTSQLGTDENPQVRDNQDIAREILDYGLSMSTYAFENTLQPGNSQLYEWDYTPAEVNPGNDGFIEYVAQLDDEILKGVGIPLEVAGQGSDSGSGYKGRLISYGGFLDIVTELMGLIIESCQSWLTPLVRLNYGENVEYEVEVISLSDIAQEEEKRNPQPGSAIGAPSPGLPGDGSAGGGAEGSPLQLSTVQAPNPLLDTLSSLTAAVAALTVKVLQPAPVQLSAVVGPDQADPQDKRAALAQTQQKLMRSRKATIAQLLALAMVKKQQEATKAGKPEAAAGSLQALSTLAGDPMQVARIVGLDAKELSAADWEELELGWAPFTTARRTVGAVNDETGKKLYGKAAQAALAREKGFPTTDKQKSRQVSRMVAANAARKAAQGEASADDLKEFADSLATLKPADLRQLGDYFKVNLHGARGGKLTGKQMLGKLLAHVDGMVAKAAKAEPAPKVDAPKAKPVSAATADALEKYKRRSAGPSDKTEILNDRGQPLEREGGVVYRGAPEAEPEQPAPEQQPAPVRTPEPEPQPALAPPPPPAPPTETAAAAPEPEPEKRPEPAPVQVQPKAAPVPAKEPRAALDELAALAGDPEKLRHAAEHAAHLARLPLSQGGSLALHDAITAADRGVYGKAAQKAMDALHRDPAYLAGTLTERYARAVAALAPVLGGKAPEQPEPVPEPKAEPAPVETEGAPDDEPLSPEEQAAADAKLAAARDRHKKRQEEFEREQAGAKATPKDDATPEQRERTAVDVFHDLLRNKYAQKRIVPIHDMRAEFKKLNPGSTERDFNDAMLNLRRNDKLRLISISNPGRATPDQLQNSVYAVGETFFYAEATPETPKQSSDFADRKAADKTSSDTEPESTPVAKSPERAVKTRPNTPPQMEQTAVDAMHDLLKGRYANLRMAPIHAVRAEWERRHPGAERGEFDDAIKELRRSGKVRTISISDPSRATPEQLRDSVQHVGETLFYLEPTHETPPESADYNAESEPAEQPAAEPTSQPAPVQTPPEPAPVQPKAPAAKKAGNPSGKSHEVKRSREVLQKIGIEHEGMKDKDAVKLSEQVQKARAAAVGLAEAVRDNANDARLNGPRGLVNRAKDALKEVPEQHRPAVEAAIKKEVAALKEKPAKAPKDRAGDLDPTLAALFGAGRKAATGPETVKPDDVKNIDRLLADAGDDEEARAELKNLQQKDESDLGVVTIDAARDAYTAAIQKAFERERQALAAKTRKETGATRAAYDAAFADHQRLKSELNAITSGKRPPALPKEAGADGKPAVTARKLEGPDAEILKKNEETLARRAALAQRKATPPTAPPELPPQPPATPPTAPEPEPAPVQTPAKGKKAPPAPSAVNLDDPAGFAAAVRAAAERVPSIVGGSADPSRGKWEMHKAPIADVYDEMVRSGSLPPGTTLDRFKAALLGAGRAMALDLGRNDLPHLSPKDYDHERNQIDHPAGATYHYVNVPGAPPAKGPPPAPKESAVPKVSDLKKSPGADKKHLDALAKAETDPVTKDYLETAAHNLRGTGTKLDPADRRHDTLERLAANYRDALANGHEASAQKVADVIRTFGGTLKGEPGERTAFDGLIHDGGAHSLFTGDPVKVVRPAVVGPDGRTAVQGLVEPA